MQIGKYAIYLSPRSTEELKMKGYEKILIKDIVNIMNITDVLTGDQMYYLFNRDNFNKNWAKA